MKFEGFSIETMMELTRLRFKAVSGDEEAMRLHEEVEKFRLLGEFYDDLKAAINNRLVLTMPSYVVLDKDYTSHASSDQRATFEEYAGIEFNYDQRDSFKTRGFERLEPCILENELTGCQELDFKDLIVERERVWQETVPIFAEILAQRLDLMLDTIPIMIYGPDETEELNLGRHMGDKVSKEAQVIVLKDDPEWLTVFQYGLLNNTQLSDLTREINLRVSHAEIALEHSGNNLVLKITYRSNRVVPEAVFDYAEYGKKYKTTVVSELEQLFNEIVNGIEKFPVEEILKHFDGVGRLVHRHNDKLNWYDEKQELKWKRFGIEVIEKGKHQSDLFERIEQKFPGIKITGATYSYGSLLSRRLFEFTYELKENISDDIRKQYDFDAAIRNVIVNKSADIVRVVVRRFLNMISADDKLARELSEYGCSKEGRKFFEVELGRFDERLEGHTLDIVNVLNEEWRGELQQLQTEMTGEDLWIGFTNYPKKDVYSWHSVIWTRTFRA